MKLRLIRTVLFAIEKLKYWYGRAIIRSTTSTFGKCGKSDISYPIAIKVPNNIFIEDGVKIGPNCSIGAFNKVFIGCNSRISANCIIETGTLNLSKRDYGVHTGKDIIIGENVWIGTGCVILGGAKIGDNTFVSPGSVLSREVPENVIVKNNKFKVREYE
jgi:acetyltransferase-like isoleucine patch superfamily enzyme